jgi:hypothetical protein
VKRHLWLELFRPRMQSIRRVRTMRAVLLLLALLLLGGAILLAQGGYDLSWWTVDDGGGSSSGGTYLLRSTAGQPDAGAMSGGVYRLDGGFWGSGEQANEEDAWRIYVPLVLKPR